LKEFQKKQSQALKDIEASSQATANQLSQTDARISELRTSLDSRHQQLRELETEIAKLKDEKAKMTELRK
jgi:hypothetical protein